VVHRRSPKTGACCLRSAAAGWAFPGFLSTAYLGDASIGDGRRKTASERPMPHDLLTELTGGAKSMIKLTSKIALVAAIAALAIAGSSSDSVARGHQKKAAACAPVWALKTHACANGVCSMLRCQPDGKWYPSLLACWQPWCPK
jgi:hypothetical protein